MLASQLDRSSRSALSYPVWLIFFILAVETTAAVHFPHPWFNIYLFRGVPVFFALILLFFGRNELRSLVSTVFQARWAALHAGLVALVVLAELYLLGFQQRSSSTVYEVIGYAWPVLLFSLVPSLLITFFPLSRLLNVARRLGRVWLYAAVSSVALVMLMEWLHRSWNRPGGDLGFFLQNSAFHGTEHLLGCFYPGIVADPHSYLLGTRRFQIIIGSTCSGVQGLALLSVLLLTWSLYDPKRLRLARVLLLGCLALAVMWSLNIIRLTALVAIGDAGYPGVAINGFHSEAGWIALNVVTLALLVVLERVPWFRKMAPSGIERQMLVVGNGVPQRMARNVPAIYLLPFLFITAASVVSHAVLGDFEWFYPLRFVAPLVVLWWYRAEYRKMDLRFGVVGVVVGLAVAALWIGLHRLQHVNGAALAGSLAAMSVGRRSVWIAFRVLAAVVTVPLAEELAFRGFLARRIMSAEVEAVPYARLTLAAVLLSAVCFGLMHGKMWELGIVSGIVFGLLAKYKGRFGEAVAAHMVANLGIAVWVLARGDFSLW